MIRPHGSQAAVAHTAGSGTLRRARAWPTALIIQAAPLHHPLPHRAAHLPLLRPALAALARPLSLPPRIKLGRRIGQTLFTETKGSCVQHNYVSATQTSTFSLITFLLLRLQFLRLSGNRSKFLRIYDCIDPALNAIYLFICG